MPLHLYFYEPCSAEILDEKNQLYTHEDDEFEGLSIKSCVLPMQNDQPASKPSKVGSKKKTKVKAIKKRLNKVRRKHLRRRGKKFCCKKGIQKRMKMTSDGSSCKNLLPDASVIDKALNAFGFNQERCSQVFQLCCSDEIVGKETFEAMRTKQKNTKNKFRQIRNKLKQKKQEKNSRKNQNV